MKICFGDAFGGHPQASNQQRSSITQSHEHLSIRQNTKNLRFVWIIQINVVSLHWNQQKHKIMATYTITLNERSNNGKALLNYLQSLGIMVQKVTKRRTTSYERSKQDIQTGRIEKFASSEEMFHSLGI